MTPICSCLVATRFGVALAKNRSDAYLGAYWAMEVVAEQRSRGGTPEVVWLFPLPVVLIKSQ